MTPNEGHYVIRLSSEEAELIDCALAVAIKTGPAYREELDKLHKRIVKNFEDQD